MLILSPAGLGFDGFGMAVGGGLSVVLFRRGVWLRLVRVGILVLIAVGGLLVSGVSEAASARPIVRAAVGVSVVVPAPGALIAAERVSVRLRVGRRVTGVRVWIGTARFRGRFSRHGRIWTVSLPRSFARAGTRRLLVQALVGKGNGGTAARSFVVGRPSSGLMVLRSGSRAMAGAGGMLGGARAVPAAGQVPVSVGTAAPTIARLTVNGHRVADLRGGQALRSHRWLVSAIDGLRVGRNQFVVLAYDAGGGYAVKRWIVRRGAALPFAEAGPQERVVASGRWTRLSASSSRTTVRGATLRYAWRVVSAPPRAKYQLRNGGAVRPSFRPATPGTYQIALSAINVRQAPGSLRATPSGPAAQDVATVFAGPALPEQGLYLDTTLGKSAGAPTLTINGTTFPSATPTTDLFVQLDATTLALVKLGTDATVTPAVGTVTIGVWQGETVDGTPAGSRIWIGIDLVATSLGAAGTLGNNAGTAIQGWLQPAAGAGSAAWMSSDTLAVKTRTASSTASTNAMEVGGQTYTSTLPSGDSSGFEVIALDRTGTPVLQTPTVVGFDGNPTDDAGAALSLNLVLQVAKDDQDTVLLQGFGPVKFPTGIPAGDAADWKVLVSTIQELGGNSDVFQNLNGTVDPSDNGAYALISGVGRFSEGNLASNVPVAKETSWQASQQGGVLSALLAPDAALGSYKPIISDPGPPDPDGVNRQGALPMIYAAPHAWNSNWITGPDQASGTQQFYTPTAAQLAAMAYIDSVAVNNKWVAAAGVAGSCPGAPDPVRASYCGLDAAVFQVLYNHIHDDLTFNQANATANGYTNADFTAAQTTLDQELDSVIDIRSQIAVYQQLYGNASIVGQVNLGTTTDAITKQIQASEAENDVDTLGIAADFVTLGSVIPEVGDAFSFIGAGMTVVSALLPHSSPQTDLPQVEITKDNVASEISQDYLQASENLNRIGDYLVSDPVKLHTAGNALGSGIYSISTNGAANFIQAAVDGTNQFLWGALLGTAYDYWTAPTIYPMNPACNLWHPFANVKTSGWWGPPNNHSGTQWWIALSQRSGDPRYYLISHSNQGLGNITDNLFKPITTNGVINPGAIGAVMPYFALDNLPTNTVPLEGAPSSQNPYDWGCEE